jgi:hypothetical protein
MLLLLLLLLLLRLHNFQRLHQPIVVPGQDQSSSIRVTPWVGLFLLPLLLLLLLRWRRLRLWTRAVLLLLLAYDVRPLLLPLLLLLLL